MSTIASFARPVVPLLSAAFLLGGMTLLITGCGSDAAPSKASPLTSPTSPTSPPTSASASPRSMMGHLASRKPRCGHVIKPKYMTLPGQPPPQRTPCGGLYWPPTRPTNTTAQAETTCRHDPVSFREGHRTVQRTVTTPPAPGLRATREGHRSVRVSYAFAPAVKDCPPAFLIITLDNTRDQLPAYNQNVRYSGPAGSEAITPPAVLGRVDVARISALTSGGFGRGESSVLIR